MKRIVALVGVALVGLLAHPTVADAAEPYDSEIASILVAPADPAFVEVLDPAVTPHSGPLSEAQLKAAGHGTPAEMAAIRGGYSRTYRSETHVLTEFGADAGAVGAAQSRLEDGLDTGGTPLTVPGATGFELTEGLTPDGVAYAVVAFVAGPRVFSLGVTGADPEHALLFAQMNAVAAAAVAVPTDAAPTTTVATGAARSAPSATTAAPASGLAAMWSEVVHDERIDYFLGGAAILLVLVLLNRAVNARRRRHVRATVGQRGNGAGRPGPAVWAPTASAWPTLGNERWPSSDEAAFPTLATPAATAAPTPVNRTAALPMEAYSGERNVGWGDEPDEPTAPSAAAATPAAEPLPPLPSRSKTPKVVPQAALLPTTGPTAAPPVAPPAPAPAPVAPAPVAAAPAAPVAPADGASPWTMSASLADEEEYSFPGAETWPGDPVGDGRA